jgi:hypothetical protein
VVAGRIVGPRRHEGREDPCARLVGVVGERGGNISNDPRRAPTTGTTGHR